MVKMQEITQEELIVDISGPSAMIEDRIIIPEELEDKLQTSTVKKDYVTNKEFLKSLVEYKEQVRIASSLGLPKPRVPEYVGECILKITENIAKRPNFSGYTFIEDMKGDAIENCLLYIDNFDENQAKKNPFGYFSRIIWFAFLRRIESESTETYVKFKSLLDSELYNNRSYEGKKFLNLNKAVLNDNTKHVVEKYEDKIKRRRDRKKLPDEVYLPTKLEEFMYE